MSVCSKEPRESTWGYWGLPWRPLGILVLVVVVVCFFAFLFKLVLSLIIIIIIFIPEWQRKNAQSGGWSLLAFSTRDSAEKGCASQLGSELLRHSKAIGSLKKKIRENGSTLEKLDKAGVVGLWLCLSILEKLDKTGVVGLWLCLIVLV